MIKHVVMWKIRDELDGKSKNEICREIKALLETLPGKIPLIRHYEVGINAIPSDASDDLILISEFDSAEDLSAYAVHPDHVKVAEVIARAKLTRNAVDYQV
jgi:hypothetical protein